jgi:tetratricopeptide (TPR) repeat protein
LDETAPEAWGLLSSCYAIAGDANQALIAGEHAVSVGPNSIEALTDYGNALVYVGKYKEAISNYQKAIRINPLVSSSLFRNLGFAYICIGQFEDAVSAVQASLQRAPRDVIAHVYLTISYSMMGRDKEAAEGAAEVLRLNPNFPVETRFSALQDKKKKDEVIDAFRKAELAAKAQNPQP